VVYVCNCNGIRERDVRAAIEQGAERPVEVFRHCQSRPQCAKCVCDVRRMIDGYRELAQIAAE
jgi:bacterioferritin-associated ferredoxin